MAGRQETGIYSEQNGLEKKRKKLIRAYQPSGQHREEIAPRIKYSWPCRVCLRKTLSGHIALKHRGLERRRVCGHGKGGSLFPSTTRSIVAGK